MTIQLLPIQDVNPERCSSALIRDKDHLHRAWFNLQSYPVKQRLEDIAYIDKAAMDQFMDDAEASIANAKVCSKAEHAPEVSSLFRTYDKIKGKIQTAEQKTRFGNEVYAMDADIASDMLIVDINKLVNIIHNLGSSFISYEGRYGGCKVSAKDDLRTVNDGALAYCEGVAFTAGRFMNSGSKVEHKMGAHSNVIKFEEDEDGYGIELDYSESGADNWDERQNEVNYKLKNTFNLDCRSAGVSTECEGKIRDPNRIRQMAYFLSSVTDVDLLPSDCIPRAADHALEQAVKVVAEEGQEAYRTAPYPSGKDGWAESICPEADAESREQRERRQINRLEYNADYHKNEIDSSLAQSKDIGCSRLAYVYMRNAIKELGYLESNCADLKDLSWGAGSDCNSRAIDKDEVIDEEINKLIERCPPKPVIDVMEADLTGNELEAALGVITETCIKVDDTDCLQGILDAINRDAAGIKQAKLPLEV